MNALPHHPTALLPEEARSTPYSPETDGPLGKYLRSAVANVERQLRDARRHAASPAPWGTTEAKWQAGCQTQIGYLEAELAERQDVVAFWDSMTAQERRYIGVMPTREDWASHKRAEVHSRIKADAASGADKRVAA